MDGSKFVGEGTHNVNLTFAQDFSITFILPPEEKAVTLKVHTIN